MDNQLSVLQLMFTAAGALCVCTRGASVRENGATTQKNVKSHVFLDFEKNVKNVKNVHIVSQTT